MPLFQNIKDVQVGFLALDVTAFERLVDLALDYLVNRSASSREAEEVMDELDIPQLKMRMESVWTASQNDQDLHARILLDFLDISARRVNNNLDWNQIQNQIRTSPPKNLDEVRATQTALAQVNIPASESLGKLFEQNPALFPDQLAEWRRYVLGYIEAGEAKTLLEGLDALRAAVRLRKEEAMLAAGRHPREISELNLEPQSVETFFDYVYKNVKASADEDAGLLVLEIAQPRQPGKQNIMSCILPMVLMMVMMFFFQ